MLGHPRVKRPTASLMFVDHLADRKRDLGGAAQRIALACHGGLDAGEVTLSGGKEFFALAGTLGGEIGVAADHEALIGEFGRGDGGHVALIEQRELQGTAFHQTF